MSRQMRRQVSDETALKFVDRHTSGQIRNNLSGSIHSVASTGSTSLSDRSIFSDRSGSTARCPLQQQQQSQHRRQQQQSTTTRRMNFDLNDYQGPQNRPRQQSLHSTSSTTNINPNRTGVCSSNITSNHGQPSRRSSHHSRPNYTQFLRRRHLIIIAIIALTSSLLSCGVTSYFFIDFFAPDFEDHRYITGDFEACLRCDQLREDIKRNVVDQLLTKIDSDNNEMCCFRNSGQLSAIIQYIMDTRKNVTVVRVSEKLKFRPSPVSVHVGSSGSNKGSLPECVKEDCHIKLNVKQDGYRQHADKVTVRKNSIEIRVPGLYYIYCSLNFKVETCSNVKTFIFHVVKINPKTISTTTLLESSHTYSKTCDITNITSYYHTSYTAGAFVLLEGEGIYVTVSGSGEVLYDETSTYLGLVMLRNMDNLSTATPFTYTTT